MAKKKQDKETTKFNVNILKTFRLKGWFLFTVLIMCILFGIFLFLYLQKDGFNYSITKPIVNGLNINEKVGSITCKSNNYKSLVSGDFLECVYNININFENAELWYENYETGEKKEISLNMNINNNIIHPPLYIGSEGNTDFFINFHLVNSTSPNYFMFFNERVKSFEEYQNELFQIRTIFIAVISLIFIIPPGVKSLKILYERKE